MHQLIDLSHNILDTMPVHPCDDPIKLYQDKFLTEDKYNNYKLESGMHVGTHIDTSMHLTNSKTFINEIPLNRFIGQAIMLDVRGEKRIAYKEKYSDIVNEGDIVLLFTNHSTKYGKKEYFTDSPVVSEELADFLVSKKIKMLGLDMPSPDESPFTIHKILFENQIPIIENLTNLSKLNEVNSFEIIAFPLKIKADSSISRVVARLLE
ncbi:cyclase family protein [Natronospora cellulosivora (SeqCode)]